MGRLGRHLVENCSRFSVWGWPSSAGEGTGGMASIVMGGSELCGRIREAARPAPRECTDAVPATAVVP